VLLKPDKLSQAVRSEKGKGMSVIASKNGCNVVVKMRFFATFGVYSFRIYSELSCIHLPTWSVSALLNISFLVGKI